MQESIALIQKEAAIAIAQSNDVADLDSIRVSFLGKKGKLTELLKGLSDLPAQDKPIVGQQINVVKREIIALIDSKLADLKERELDAKIGREAIDVTLPGR